MKLRQLHSDFRVEEISDIHFSKEKDAYKLYTLEKSGMETFYLLGYLAKSNGIPLSEISIAGMKDKHALTKQHLTIPSKYDIKTLKEKNFSIVFLGYTKEKIKMGQLSGNRFEITVRQIMKGELDGVYEKANTITKIGVPNYFDSQRFGNALGGGFVVKHVLKKDYEAAVKVFLTTFTRFEKREIKDDKKRILAHWGDFRKLKMSNSVLAAPIDEYLKTKSWAAAYKRIPQNLRDFFVSSYQSYLWNECVKELLRKTVNTKYAYSIEYNLGSLLFYKKLPHDEMQKLPKTFKTISDEIVPSAAEKRIIDKILAREEVFIDDFRIKDAVGNFFKTRERDVIIRPSDFSIQQPMVDELNDEGRNSRFKITVSFTLPKGSYATIIIKRLFHQ